MNSIYRYPSICQSIYLSIIYFIIALPSLSIYLSFFLTIEMLINNLRKYNMYEHILPVDAPLYCQDSTMFEASMENSRK